MEFVTWSTLDEMSAGQASEGAVYAGELVEEFSRMAEARGHRHHTGNEGTPPSVAWIAVNGPDARGGHLEVPEIFETMFHLRLGLEGDHLIEWRVQGQTHKAEVGFRFAAEFVMFLDALEPSGIPLRSSVGPDLEALAATWRTVAPLVRISMEERRTADALAVLCGELAKVETPPDSVVREVLHWFKPRVDRFADEFASSAGKAAGVAAVGGLGVAASRIPVLREIVERLLGQIGP